MKYFRVHLDKYIEGKFNTWEEALKEFQAYLMDEFTTDDLTVEVFNKDTEEWRQL